MFDFTLEVRHAHFKVEVSSVQAGSGEGEIR
jgi:hypothetical protein